MYKRQYPDLKVEGQKQLYLALKAANDPDADGLLKDIVLQNRSEGFDLGIGAGADAMNEKLKAQDWDGARLVYERTIRDFGQEGGLTPVSYTHLDVYKRQISSWPSKARRRSAARTSRRSLTRIATRWPATSWPFPIRR